MRGAGQEGKTSGKSGYAPACANEWRAGVCEKPRIKCADCSNRLLIPLSDTVIYDHLAGEHTVGVYPLLEDDSCYFLAVDFDEAEWRDDARAFMQSCDALGVPAALEISRSGRGAHAWVFFASRVSARDARRLARDATPMQRQMIDALIQRYSGKEKTRALRFARAMDRIAKRHADDVSVADFMLYPNYAARKPLIDAAGGFANLHRWGATMAARPGVQKGMNPF